MKKLTIDVHEYLRIEVWLELKVACLHWPTKSIHCTIDELLEGLKLARSR